MNVDLRITSLQSFNYKLIENYVYVDLNDACGFSTFRMAIVIKEVNNDAFKNIIERYLEDNLIYIEKVEFCEDNNELKYVLGGDIEDIKSFRSKIKSKNVFIKIR